MKDEYATVARRAEVEIKIQGSRFLAVTGHAQTRVACMEILDHLRKEYFDATHHCYGYRLGVRGEEFRVHDDGEPGGTAGRPILSAIDGQELTDTIVVVVRYFGGTKLGTGGLARAYGDAAASSLEHAGRVIKYVTLRLLVTLPHAQTGNVMNTISQHGAKIVDSTYDEDVHLTLDVRLSVVDALRKHLINATRGNVDIRPGPESAGR